jgi:hypothetical protein
MFRAVCPRQAELGPWGGRPQGGRQVTFESYQGRPKPDLDELIRQARPTAHLSPAAAVKALRGNPYSNALNNKHM